MDIKFPKESMYDTDRTAVKFPAIVDGKRIRVYVSKEALQDHFGADQGGNFCAYFEQNREKIELMAQKNMHMVSGDSLILQTSFF